MPKVVQTHRIQTGTSLRTRMNAFVTSFGAQWPVAPGLVEKTMSVQMTMPQPAAREPADPVGNQSTEIGVRVERDPP